MQKYLSLTTALLLFGVSGCSEPHHGPAPVINLGIHADSATGAIMVGAHDNLWDIAKRYRLPIREIIDLNGLEPPYRLAEGRRLKMPAPVDYRVRGGDTLHTVASMFGVSASQLVAVNNIQAPYRINPGQDLRIPSAMRQQQQQQTAAAVAVPVVNEPPVQMQSLAPVPVIREHVQPPTTLVNSTRPDFMWPVRGKVISGYGPKEDGLYNDGINIAAPRGAPVVAAAEGIVAYVGNDLKSYGNLILIRHGGGTMTAYAHLASINARKGMAIHKGQVIGTVGSTGAVPVSQLHFEIRHGSKTCDPKQYLG